MAMKTLEDLHESLQMTRKKSQKALDKREIGVLSRVFDIDEEGRPAFVVWECRLPTGDGGERRHEMLRLPWDSFYQSENVITELSVEIDCDIREKKSVPGDSEINYSLRPAASGLIGRFGKPQQKFKLNLEADKDYVAEATVDGIPLDEFLELTRHPLQDSKTSIYESIRTTLKNIAKGWLILLLLIITLVGIWWLRYSGHI